MDRLRSLLDRHSRWQPLCEYVDRIDGYRTTDFSISVENSKSLLESIAKEICHQKKHPLNGTENVSRLLSFAFASLGYPESDTIRQIGRSIANVAQQIGNFRNAIGTTAHGKTLDELENRKKSVESLTDDFLLNATELVCCFLIDAFETDNPLHVPEPVLEYEENADFNEFWDDQYGDFAMGNYSFPASDILHKLDYLAYSSELNAYRAIGNETDNGE
jgi:hypothetical protein